MALRGREQKYNGIWKIPTLMEYLEVVQVQAPVTSVVY